MKTSFKLATLAALTAATLALPAAAQDTKDAAKCSPKAGMSKCGVKKSVAKHKHGTKKSMAKCGAKCGAKCAPKCAAKM